MCTAFLAYQTGVFGITGRSLDYDQPTTFVTTQTPAGTTFNSVLNNGVSWVSKYAIFTIDSVESYNVPFEGMNSMGLSISGNLANADYPQNNQGPTISSDDIVNYVLSQAQSIVEAAALLTTINIQSPWKYHYIVFDSIGDSLVVEYENQLAVAYVNESLVLTNNPNLNYQLENQNNYAHIQNWSPNAILPDSGDQFHGQGMLGLPGDWMSPSRYTRASTMLKYALSQVTSNNDAIYLSKRILDNVSLIKGIDMGGSATGLPIYTQVQIVKDILNNVVYWRTYDAEEWTVVNIQW